MTERLYYTDSYCTSFSARVIERLVWEDQPAVVLDRTAFYPTSGGQPADRGTLGGTVSCGDPRRYTVALLDVVAREKDGAIVHVLERALPEADVAGEVDWPRRFDHMQQHTGQHILSAAFEQLLGAGTVGFHLGTEASTIDLDVAQLDQETVSPVESLANRIVWEDRPVDARFADPSNREWRRLSSPLPEPVRIVEVADFDVNPCGGTHVARAGEIGLIKITRLDHRGDETRVEFLCGGRALRDYRAKNGMAHRLASMLTVGHWELDRAVDRLQAEAKQLRRDLRQARGRLLELEATELAATAVVHGPYRVVWRIWEQPGKPAEELRTLARKLTEHPGMVALLISAGERTELCFARAEELDLDVAALLREACAELGGRGGGRPQAAQGSGPATDPSRIKAVLSNLLSNLASRE